MLFFLNCRKKCCIIKLIKKWHVWRNPPATYNSWHLSSNVFLKNTANCCVLLVEGME